MSSIMPLKRMATAVLIACAGDRFALSSPVAAIPRLPTGYGVASYTVLSLPITLFSAVDPSQNYSSDGNDFFRYFATGSGTLVGGAILPAGAIIDYVGLGACDPVGAAFAARVFRRTAFGGSYTVAEFGSTPHTGGIPCLVDYNEQAIGYLVSFNSGATIQVAVEQLPGSPTDGSARVGSVEIWYRLSISPAPAVQSFGDVPISHPFFQVIEALRAAGITSGCGGGNYCPDAPATRAQVAAMLARALGLHWPG